MCAKGSLVLSPKPKAPKRSTSKSLYKKGLGSIVFFSWLGGWVKALEGRWQPCTLEASVFKSLGTVRVFGFPCFEVFVFGRGGGGGGVSFRSP